MNIMMDYWGRFALRCGTISPRSIPDFLAEFPSTLAPLYFSESEKLSPRPACAVSNKRELSRYLSRGKPWFLFHGDGYYVDLQASAGPYDVVLLFARSMSQHMATSRFLSSVLSATLVYGNAALAAEHEHRNGHEILVNETRKPAHLWLGQDFRRYVPGLYWGNAFSHEYVSAHSIDLGAITSRLGAQVVAMENGVWFELYDTPEKWIQHSDGVDKFLAESPAFFSKQDVELPNTVAARELVTLLGHIGQRWP